MNTKLALPIFVLLGLLLAAPGEVLNQILSRSDFKAFKSTMVSYTVLLVIGYFAYGGFHQLARTKARATLIYYLFFGTLGLMVEWFLLNNAPNFRDPFQPITHVGMFTFWGTLLLGPRLLMESAEFNSLKKSFALFFLSFSGLYLLVGSVIPRDRGGIFFGFIIFATGSAILNYFYFRYFKQLRQLSCAPVST